MSRESNELFKRLAQQDPEGRNALMHAISKGDIVNAFAILGQISTLTQDERFMLLKQQDEYGRNTLSNAVIMKNQEVAKLILDQISMLTQDERFVLLAQQDFQRRNALMYVLRNKLTEVESIILNQIHDLEEDERLCLLSQHDKERHNALMHAISTKRIGVVSSILCHIGGLGSNKQCELLAQQDTKGNNTLVHAIVHAKNNEGNDGAQLILDQISKLELDKQYKLLGQQNKNAKNALMIAAVLDGVEVLLVRMLQILAGLSSDTKKLILMNSIKECVPSVLDPITITNAVIRAGQYTSKGKRFSLPSLLEDDYNENLPNHSDKTYIQFAIEQAIIADKQQVLLDILDSIEESPVKNQLSNFACDLYGQRAKNVPMALCCVSVGLSNRDMITDYGSTVEQTLINKKTWQCEINKWKISLASKLMLQTALTDKEHKELQDNIKDSNKFCKILKRIKARQEKNQQTALTDKELKELQDNIEDSKVRARKQWIEDTDKLRDILTRIKDRQEKNQWIAITYNFCKRNNAMSILLCCVSREQLHESMRIYHQQMNVRDDKGCIDIKNWDETDEKNYVEMLYDNRTLVILTCIIKNKFRSLFKKLQAIAAKATHGPKANSHASMFKTIDSKKAYLTEIDKLLKHIVEDTANEQKMHFFPSDIIRLASNVKRHVFWYLYESAEISTQNNYLMELLRDKTSEKVTKPTGQKETQEPSPMTRKGP